MSTARKLIGDQLRELRERRKMPIAEAAQLAQLQPAQIELIENEGGGRYLTAVQYAMGAFRKKIVVRGFRWSAKRGDVAKLARGANLDEHTTRMVLRQLHGPQHPVTDHYARGAPDGEERQVILKAEQVDLLSVESVLAEWGPDAALALE